MLLEGLFAPITSCFYSDGRPYWKKLEHNVGRYSRTRLSGLVVLGSTGEAVMLSDEETVESLRVARGAAAPEKVLIAGVGRESAAETLRLAETAAKLEYDAILVRTPHYYRKQLGNRELLTYYQTVADHSVLPVVLYSIPSCTGYELPVSIVAELAAHPNIIGIKDSAGRAERIRELTEAVKEAPKRTVTVTNVFEAVTARMVRASRSSLVSIQTLSSGSGAVGGAESERPALQTRTKEAGFQVLCGSAHLFLASLEAGAAGGILGMATFAPQAMQEIHTAWKERDTELAEEKQRRVDEASREVCSSMGIPGVKYALDLNGYYGGRPRLPLLPLDDARRHKVEELLLDIRN